MIYASKHFDSRFWSLDTRQIEHPIYHHLSRWLLISCFEVHLLFPLSRI